MNEARSDEQASSQALNRVQAEISALRHLVGKDEVAAMRRAV